MQLVSRFLFSALIGTVAALFAALLLGAILPRFSYSLEIWYALVGVVFILAAGYAAPQVQRRVITLILVFVGTAALAALVFRSEPLSFLIGASLAYAFHRFRGRA